MRDQWSLKVARLYSQKNLDRIGGLSLRFEV